MKILCVSDEVDPLVYSPRAKEHFPDIDFILSAGDLPMEYLGFIASTFNKPLFFVFGNHNLKYLSMFTNKIRATPFNTVDISPHKFGSTYIDGKITRYKDIIIAGIGGSYKYNNGQNQFTDFQIYVKLIKMIPRLLYNKIRYGRYLDILLTHSPPYGINDKQDICHRGFKAFLWFIKTFKPSYLLHGHVHLYNSLETRISQYYNTKIINVFKHYLLEV
ncbi:metallophosphoesterase [Spirochaetia bacterium 38H-sp]|uniref:Metallophosphoesterase n=1 Tax=Rarispira pelagica TaxID=3141764 RepID=A0ABU9UC25_9SPIR